MEVESRPGSQLPLSRPKISICKSSKAQVQSAEEGFPQQRGNVKSLRGRLRKTTCAWCDIWEGYKRKLLLLAGGVTGGGSLDARSYSRTAQPAVYGSVAADPCGPEAVEQLRGWQSVFPQDISEPSYWRRCESSGVIEMG